MKNSVIALFVGYLSLLALDISCGYAQQTQEQEALMQKWIEFMTPGAKHELLKQKVGKWTLKMEMWTAPGATATVSDGTAEVKLIMGDRYLSATAKSNFQGQPFEAFSIAGYDKLKKKFVTVWIDNFGTGFTISSGTYDEPTKSFNYTTMSPDIESGEYKRTRTVERIVSQDEWVVEMYDTTSEGKEFLMMKGVYKRVK